MFTESFGDRSKYLYGMALSVLLTKDDLDVQTFTSRLLQEYSFQNVTKSSRLPSKECACVASSSCYKKIQNPNETNLCYCNKKGHYRDNCYEWKRWEPIARVREDLTMLFVDVNLGTAAGQ